MRRARRQAAVGAFVRALLCAATIVAAAPVASLAARPAPGEREGLALLDSIESANRDLTDLSARFTETTFMPLFEDSVVARGEILFQKPGRLLLRYGAPDSSLLVVNAKTVWLHQPSQRQAHRFVLSEESTVFGLLLGFGGSFEEAKKHFTFLADGSSAKRGERTLRAVPRPGSRAAEDLEEILLTVDRARRWLPLRTRFREVGGDERLFAFGDFRRNDRQPASCFEFTPPAGTEVFDMGK